MKNYEVIYADPPWSFSSRLLSTPAGGSEWKSLEKHHYPTMRLDEMKNLEVEKISKENAVLFLWTTDAHLPEAIALMKSWGFVYKTVAFNWIKMKSDMTLSGKMGTWTVKSGEICLLGTRGKPYYLAENRKQRQVLFAPRKEHSKKPNEVRERIELMVPNAKRIELFAREKHPNWDSWGNEVESDIGLTRIPTKP